MHENEQHRRRKIEPLFSNIRCVGISFPSDRMKNKKILTDEFETP